MISEVLDGLLQTVKRIGSFDVKLLLVPLLIAVCVAIVLFFVRSLALKVLSRWTARTRNGIDDTIISCLRGPSILWCIAAAIHVGVAASDMPVKYVTYLTRAVDVFVIFSITMAAGNVATRLLDGILQASTLPLKSTGLMHGILKGVIFLIGFLFILTSLHISITPLITTLGVGGLAVALALQDTLTNLFAGIHILIEKSIRVGDFVKIESGEEGYIEDITWRTTRIRMLPNNMVIIPNSKLAKSTVINYHLPETRMSLLIPVSVSYASSPRRVVEILIEEAKNAAGQIPGLRADPEPFVRFIPGFGESSLDFTLICQVDEFTDQYLAQHELRMRIFERFRQEGIEIPFPQRTVHVKES
jgi:small-conductance mechanosensitive channel